MTSEEKRINKGDLKGFKEGNAKQMQAMIPGIYNLNTVGASPLKRGARQIIDGGGYLTSRQPSALG